MSAGGIYAGGRVTADDLQGVAPLAVVKSADQSSPVSSTVNVSDSQLTLNLAASAVYRILFTPLLTAVAGSDMQITFAVPSGAQFNYSLLHQGGGGTLYLDTGSTASGGKLAYRYYGAGASVQSAFLAGTILTASAGPLTVQFGQFANPSATPCVMKAGSEIDAWKIG